MFKTCFGECCMDFCGLMFPSDFLSGPKNLVLGVNEHWEILNIAVSRYS